MLSFVKSLFVTSKPEVAVDTYRFPEPLRKVLPDNLSIFAAIDFCRDLEQRYDLTFDEVEVLMFLMGQTGWIYQVDVTLESRHLTPSETAVIIDKLVDKNLVQRNAGVVIDQICINPLTITNIKFMT